MRKALVIGDHPLVASCTAELEGHGVTVDRVVTDDAGLSSWATGSGRRLIAWPDVATALREDPADLLVSAGNLRIVPDEVLAAVPLAVNFHDGPLPELAGLHAPMWAILAGASEHGITWHVMEPEIDAGDIVASRRFPIAPDETTRSLNLVCFQAGAAAFAEIAPQLASGTVHREPQTQPHGAYHGRWERPLPDGLIDPYSMDHEAIDRIVRALDFGPTINRVGRPLLAVGTGLVVVESVATRPDLDLGPGEIDGAAIDGGRVELTIGTTGEAIRLVGAVPPGFSVTGDDRVARPTDELDRIAAARAERAWAADLERPATALHGVPTGGGTGRTGAEADSGCDDWLGAAARVAVFLARRNGTPDATVGLGLDVAAAAPPSIASVGPLPVVLAGAVGDAVDSVRAEIVTRCERGPLLVDLTLRRPVQTDGPAVAPRFPATIVRRTDERDHWTPGSAVVVHVGDDGRCSFETLEASASSRLAAGFAAFVADCDANPTTPVGDVQCMGADELTLVTGPEPAAPPPGAATLHEAFAAVAAATPDRSAVAHGATSWTYAELDDAARRVAARLVEEGVGPGQPVGLSAAPSCAAVAGLLGILMAGATYVPLDPRFPLERLRLMVDDVGMTVALVDASAPDAVAPTAIHLQSLLADASIERLAEPVAVAHDALAYIMYTSGSTGAPKGVMVEHRNVLSFLDAMEPIVDADTGTWLSVTTLSFDISVLEIFHPLLHGWKVVLYEGLGAASAGAGLDMSLFFFGADTDSDYTLMLDVARFGDSNGFAAVWTPERHFHAFGGPFPNPSVTGAAIAAVTERIGIRAGSCVLPLHHPVRVAEEWSVVDRLSGGRVGLSVAAGWHPDDFVLRPENYRLPKPVLAEQIDTLRALWRGDAVSFDGPEGPVEVTTLPRPVQGELPIWYTTAGNPASFEFAGRHGLNILTHLLGQSLDQVAANVAAYRAAWTAAGHPGEGRVVLMLHTYVGDSRDAVRDIVREPMKAYLGDSVGLLRDVASSFPTFTPSADADDLLAGLSEDDLDALLEAAFERYFETSALFGSLDDVVATGDAVLAADIDEIACLVDFGVDSDLVRESLPHLAEARRRLATRNGLPDTYGTLIERHGVTHFQCTPSEARLVLADDQSAARLGDLQSMLVGGEALPVETAGRLLDRLHGPLTNMYGPTETTIWSTAHRVSATDVEAGAIPIGQPLRNTIARVVDDGDRPQPVGVPGELLLGGHGVTRGYFQKPDRTAERFVEIEGRRMYRTGDVASRRPDGSLAFHGRADDQVKIRGHRVELGDIETALVALPGVAQAVATYDAPTSVLVAHVVADDSADGAADLMRALATTLPAHMVPAAVHFHEQFPLTPNGKIDRLAVAAASTATDSVAGQPPPSAGAVIEPAAALAEARRPTHEVAPIIEEVWRAVLGIETIGRDVSFFDLGGNSLQVVTARQHLVDALGRPISLVDLFRYPTVNALAGVLGVDAPATAVGDVTAPRTRETTDGTPSPQAAAERVARRAEARRRARRR